MAGAHHLKTWTWLHKWSSLVCTAFMLLLCLTGLPLIFHHEIDHLLGNEVVVADMPANTPRASLDLVMRSAQALYPDRIVQFASQPEDDDRLWFVTLTPTPEPTDDFKSIAVDARTGQVVTQVPVGQGFMNVMFHLHVDLFADLPGKLFLGLMGVLLLLAIVSGVVLYAPFMRKLDFGTVRRQRSTRTRWLDLHNLLGIATLVWALVVGATGVINTWADLVIKYWQFDQMSALLAPYKGLPLVPTAQRGLVQQTLDAALAQAPGTKLSFVAFPGTSFSTPHHNTFFLRGNTPLTARMLQPVMVDARSTEVSAAPPMPWYVSTLLLSQPLHFGDYGGLPMKILWALLDITTIVVLSSGLYLWLSRRTPKAHTTGSRTPAPQPRGEAA
jgi:uncharacterized iron-regulated membrane protein